MTPVQASVRGWPSAARTPLARSLWLGLLALLVLAMAVCFGPVQAQPQGPAGDPAANDGSVNGSESAAATPGAPLASDPGRRLDRLSRTLEQAQQELRSDLVTETRMGFWRERLPEIRQQARRMADAAAQRVQSIRPLLDALGPAPEEGDEPVPVARERSKLNDELLRFVSLQKQAELVVARVEELTQTLLNARRTRFTERLLQRGPSVFALSTWQVAIPDLFDASLRAVRVLANAPKQASGLGSWSEAISPHVVVLLVVLILAWPLRNDLLRRCGRDRRVVEPTYQQRLLAAVGEGSVRTLVPALAVGGVYLVLHGQGLLHGLAEPLARSVAYAIVFFSLVSSVARAALAPHASAWRVIHFTDRCALRLNRMVTALAAVYATDTVVVQLGRELQVSRDLAVVHNFVIGIVFMVLILRLLAGDMWRRSPDAGTDALSSAGEEGKAPEDPHEFEGQADTGGDTVTGVLQLLRLLIGVTALAIPITAAFGYWELSRFLTTRLVLTGVLVVLVVVLLGLARELVVHALTPGSGPGRRLARHIGLQASGLERLQFWLVMLFNLVFIATAVVLALPLWGMGWDVLGTWLHRLVFGLQIGGISISLLDLVTALAVFFFILGASRIGQRVLSRRVFPHTRMDVGVRHSLNAALGYGGVVIGTLLAISALGLDLSNLAIIAGALSVGIGFGLQTIVNNFVSGLILLIERPVKVGDWIVVGPYEGFVKRINVRATEIETFDRSSVMVPNSDLVSSAVTNWTLHNRQCRLIVGVRVPFGSDTQQVYDLLLECAYAHRDILRWPAPHVLLMDFGEIGLEFELRCYARDVNHFLSAPSELRLAIDARLREAGIDIPYPTRDIHVRTVPWEGPTPAAGGTMTGEPHGSEARGFAAGPEADGGE